MANKYPKLHNAMWPGLVGKGSEADEPAIGLEQMLDWTAAATVDGQRFDGVDLFLYQPHIDIDIDDDGLKRVADGIATRGLVVGSVVAPVWFSASAMGDATQRRNFVTAVRKACSIAQRLDRLGLRRYGVVRIDSAASPADWAADPEGNQRTIAATIREAAQVALDHGQRLAAEGEICWGGMHSWRRMVELLERVGQPDALGFQADLAHTYLYLLGYNAPEDALVRAGYNDDEFWVAYAKMTDALRPWTIDFHVAQNDGTVKGSGSHDKTGRHCAADDPRGKLDIVRCAGYWLRGAAERGMQHICWDACMLPNRTLADPRTWRSVLEVMIRVRDEHGWEQAGSVGKPTAARATSRVSSS